MSVLVQNYKLCYCKEWTLEKVMTISLLFGVFSL